MFFDDLNLACAATFGEPATLRRPGQPDATVSGIFDRRHYQADVGDSAVSTLHTTLTVMDADIGGPVPPGSTVTVRGKAYSVADLRPDGQGMAALVLRDA
ncbi:head-tail joining protein [Azospirillum doebereinerae]|uniref:Uncharacterized protein n=1 Tax=Azospirillum doebereinerae TaxID=92933 RepID=A0A433J193_9PROT|nr:hypothetical protein [Azospirillum doebereinerae]RUQ63986.1 hypothetical protein EJ913_27060 [Azospirillum doebereinerae]